MMRLRDRKDLATIHKEEEIEGKLKLAFNYFNIDKKNQDEGQILEDDFSDASSLPDVEIETDNDVEDEKYINSDDEA